MNNKGAQIMLIKAKQIQENINELILMLEGIIAKETDSPSTPNTYDPDGYLEQWVKYTDKNS